MKTKLVEVTAHEDGWKGTWYKTGQKHFVQQDPDWPKVMACRWRTNASHGIHDHHCREVRGPIAWLRCAWNAIAS